MTGFEPFGSSSLNPSQAIVEQLDRAAIAGAELHCHVLPVTFEGASTRLLELIASLQPDVVLSLGQAEGRAQITPERVAVNLDDARLPDNSGEIRTDVPIDPSAPTAHFTTLPVKAIVEELVAAGIPSALSMSAGTFICNHVFFTMQQALSATNVRSGFMHVPLMREQAAEFPGLPTMDLTTMVHATERAIAVCIR